MALADPSQNVTDGGMASVREVGWADGKRRLDAWAGEQQGCLVGVDGGKEGSAMTTVPSDDPRMRSALALHSTKRPRGAFL